MYCFSKIKEQYSMCHVESYPFFFLYLMKSTLCPFLTISSTRDVSSLELSVFSIFKVWSYNLKVGMPLKVWSYNLEVGMPFKKT